MNRVCPITVPCLPDLPLGNFSSEAPDPFLFTRFHWPVFDPRNPIGGGRPPVPPVYFAGDCAGICTSTVSQADADLCAQRQGYICEHTPPGGHPPMFFSNAQQVCTIACDDTSTFFWVVPNGVFVGMTQAEADQRAFNYACTQVALHFFCLNPIDNEAQAGVPYNATIFVEEGAPRQPVFFSLVSGTLPPGLHLTPEGPLSTLLHGTPTASGTYTFTIQATDAQAIFVQKTYTITVTSACSTFWTSVAANWVAQTSNAQCVATVVGNVVTVSAYIVGNTHFSAVAEETNGFPVPTPAVTDTFQCTLTVVPVAIVNVGAVAQISINVTDFITPAVYLSFTGLPGAPVVLSFTLPVGAKPIVDIQTVVQSPANGLDSQVAYSVSLG